MSGTVAVGEISTKGFRVQFLAPAAKDYLGEDVVNSTVKMNSQSDSVCDFTYSEKKRNHSKSVSGILIRVQTNVF